MKFFRKHQKKIIAALALFLAILMLLPAISMIFGSAGAVSQSEIDGLKADASKLEEQKKELESDLKELKKKRDSAYDQKLIVEQEIMLVQEQIDNTQAIINEYDEKIAQAQVELEDCLAQEAEHYQEFCRRVRAMEEEGTVTYWHIIFNAASFSDLLDKAMMVSEVVEYDNAVMDALEQARKQVEESKATLEQSKAEQVSAKNLLDEQKAELALKRADVDELLAEIQTNMDKYESKIAHLDQQFDDVEAEIRKKQKELEQQIAAGQLQINPGTGYLWPLDGCYVITSLAGDRVHPVTGKPNNHLGIDVRADYGTPIKAARGGVVLISTYHWSYGNYVVVDHGNGDSTLYAHMSSRSVKVGQVVTQGQKLGEIGSTGSSTGNHLHFEVKVGYVRRDPVDYYPGLNLWVLHNGVPIPLPH